MATFQEFQTALNNSGLANQFSQKDLEMAQNNPDFGMSILDLKNSFANATTDEEKNAYHDKAERLRSSYGAYSGGADGSQNISDGLAANQAKDLQNALADYGSFSFTNPYTDALNSAISNLQSMGSFSWDGTAPTYTNQYADLQKNLLDAILNRDPFSYDKDTDPQWAAYKKEYLREGDRATANALAQAAAASGGRPSSYAQTAATQAGDYYAGQLADIIPTLYQQAYDRYLNEYSMKQQDLSAVNNQEQLDYSKYLNDLSQYNTDRSFALDAFNTNQSAAQSLAGLLADLDNQAYNQAYNTWSGNYDLLNSQYNTLRGQADSEYNTYLDALDRVAAQEQTDYERAQTEYQKEQANQQLYRDMVDAMLQTGTIPSMELLGQSGYEQEYANALGSYYQNKLAEEMIKAATSSGGSSGSGSGGSKTSSGTGSQDYSGLYAAAKASGNPQSYIANNYKKFGFTSSTGLYNDYKNWLAEAEDEGSRAGSAYQSIYNQIANVNPGTIANVPAYFSQKIEAALAKGNITEDEAAKLLSLLGV